VRSEAATAATSERQDHRQVILQAATLLIEHGPAGISTRAVATAANDWATRLHRQPVATAT